ncbi:putative protein SICKLE [Helianthus annuus]|nr:putative protein SICKLE [Helianthus annuus]
MRMEASQEDATYNNDHSAVSLANPLLEFTTNSETKAQTTSQSFDYYTNPVAAYYGNKHRSQVSLQTNETFPSPFLQPHISHSPNAQMQQPQGYYASSNHAYSSNPPQSSSLTYPSWRSNSPHPRGYSAPQGVGFPSPQTHFTSGSGQGCYPSPGSSPHFTNRPVVQDEVTLALDPTSEIVPILPTAQVMVQGAATLVPDPTLGIAPTMARVKEGTLAQVQVPGEGEGEDGAIIMYLQKTGSIVSTISQWWKTLGSF